MRSQKPPRGAIRIETYAGLDPYVHAFASGAFNLVVLLGDPGLQKSRVVRDVLPKACWIEGAATAFGMYKRLFEYRDQPIVVDDVDSLYSNPAAVRLLKCLCQTDARKSVAWETDSPALDKEGIPRRFTTSSSVMIVANAWRTLDANVQALEDRGHVLHFAPSGLEVHARTAQWFWDQEVFDWIGSQMHLVERPSMRLYHAAWELKRAGLDWRSGLLGRWMSGGRLLAARIRADDAFASEEERAAAFVARGGGCRATYFNHVRGLRPKTPVPGFILTAREPASGRAARREGGGGIRRRAGG
ncbi:MAG: hypothetical protein P4L85_14020 [Paludisphaera borealis]|uniref:hypothetical protein n=1 Tax=Paludisphaera borealis TaxID=1387353 RepID=UPI00284C1A2B|nr:hypothetical protein [Paludisphaera borealis]MDR3620463.1 hypothetical protein [Paludisphaera borealis]